MKKKTSEKPPLLWGNSEVKRAESREAPRNKKRRDLTAQKAADLLAANTQNKIVKPVNGFERFYLATDQGEIISLRNGHVLRAGMCNAGYLGITLCGNDMSRQASVHTFIAETFLGHAPTPKHEANHINGDKLDNRPVNLEWVSRPENIQHAYRTGLIPRGDKSHLCTKLDESKVRQILALKGSASQSEIARQFNISQTYVGKIHRRIKWQHIKTP
jgi:hypothetical protein